MPVYEYKCEDCGVFETMAPMRQFADPCDCPACGAASPRVMLSVPHLSAVSSTTRRAHEVNERASDSPRHSSDGPPQSGRGAAAKLSRKAMHRPDGSRSFPAARPWMLSH